MIKIGTRKIIIFLIALLALICITSCAKRSLVKIKPVKKGKVGEEYVVQKSVNKTPKWIDDPEFQVIKEKRVKYIIVKADVSDYKDKRACERIAEGELRKKVAEGIKTLVYSQFKEAISGTKATTTETYESNVETVANSIPVIGLIVTDTYWEKIQRIKSENEVEYLYRVIKKGKMPYENYVNARDNAWRDSIAQAKNDIEKKELEEALSNVKSRDAE